MKKSGQGFTLIELTIVLFIVSLLLGGILGPLSTRMEVEERNKTELLLEEAKNSLVGFALVNGYLPCPDCNSTTGNCGSAGLTANDGIEDGVDGGAGVSPRAGHTFQSCANEEGNLPWGTLGISETDAWGNRFHYRVDQTYADDIDGTDETGCEPTTGMSFHICSSGNIDIDNTAPAGVAVAQNVPALVLSLGANVDDAGNPSSTLEVENQDVELVGDPLYVDAPYSKVAANQFDDMLVWITNNTLIYRMVQAEKLP
jgi:prepilin-type N-terminal cleavage/methylation domain-containing protein